MHIKNGQFSKIDLWPLHLVRHWCPCRSLFITCLKRCNFWSVNDMGSLGECVFYLMMVNLNSMSSCIYHFEEWLKENTFYICSQLTSGIKLNFLYSIGYIGSSANFDLLRQNSELTVFLLYFWLKNLKNLTSKYK